MTDRYYAIRIICSAIGNKTEHDWRWLSFYDPKAGKHGRIESTSDPLKALHFASKGAAMTAYQASNGKRPDGRPNRPLTAWTVAIEPIDDPV